MKWSIETGLLKLQEKLSASERCAFLSAMAMGFFTHGFIFYNKLSYLDDSTYYFSLGATYGSGRWALGVIEAIRNYLELQSFSMPVINGVITIFLIAVMAIFLVRMLHIHNKLYAVLLGAYMVVFPAVTSTFAYMFTAPYYFFATLLMVLAVYGVKKSNWGIVPAILMIAFGMGIYQANIGVATATFVAALLCDAKNHGFAENILRAVRCFVTLVLGIVLYFVLNNVCLNVTGTKLGDYQGISNMADLTVANIFSGVIKAYKLWPQLTRWEILGISNTSLIRGLYAVTLIVFIILGVMYLYEVYKKKDIWNTLYTCALVAVVPLSLGVIHIMTASPGAYVHTLMVYCLIFIPVYPLALLENVEFANLNQVKPQILCWLQNISIVTICLMTMFYFRLDNTAYLKANYQQENAVAYYTTLFTQIKSAENYSDRMPVLFLGSVDGQDWSVKSPKEFESIQIQGYHTNMNNFISYFANTKFWEIHCGYRFSVPRESDIEKIKEMQYVKKMPCYPNDGAIQVIDDVVVVKFSKKY